MSRRRSRNDRAAPRPLLAASLGLGLGVALCAFVPAAEAAKCPKGTEHQTHTVKSGQTFSGIAVKYGVSQRDLERANPGVKPDMIRIGQTLDVCVGGSGDAGGSSSGKVNSARATRLGGCGGDRDLYEVTVQKGDTVVNLLKEFDTSASSFYARNKELEDDPSSLRVGQKLQICAGSSGSPGKPRLSKACNLETPLYEHEVLPGEYLSQIAGRYGVRRKELYRLNPGLSGNSTIRPGQIIKVCPDLAPQKRVQLTHTVKSGETLSKIAKKYDLSTRELLAFQRGKVKDANSLRVGQELVVYQDSGPEAGFGGTYSDFKGVLSAGVQMPISGKYVVKNPHLAWGTGNTINNTQKAIANYRKAKPGGPKVRIGDISKKGGGHFPPHESHQKGRDVDVGYVLTGKYADENKFMKATKDRIDAERSFYLIKAFYDTGAVRYIFVDYEVQKILYEWAEDHGINKDLLDEMFQYPRKKGHGIVRHWKGHDNHFHVRFRQ